MYTLPFLLNYCRTNIAQTNEYQIFLLTLHTSMSSLNHLRSCVKYLFCVSLHACMHTSQSQGIDVCLGTVPVLMSIPFLQEDLLHSWTCIIVD